MKIETTGILTDRMSRKFTKKDGTNGLSATIIVKTGESEYGDKLLIFETAKSEHIEIIKNLKIGDNVKVSGFLNAIVGTSKTGNKYAINKINLSSIYQVRDTPVLPATPTNPEPQIDDNKDDLPF